MELYKELAVKGCFSREDVIQFTGSENSARWKIQNYLKKGFIERIRRDLYAVISLETNQPIPSRYRIASCIAKDSCVSHHSAFEYYGYANQVFNTVYFSAKGRFTSFRYNGVTYIQTPWKGDVEVYETSSGIRVTSVERTVIDSVADPKIAGGMEELLRCLMLVPSLSKEKLLKSLECYHQEQLYQKIGYVLEALKDEIPVEESFFSDCEKRISKSKTYLTEEHDDFIYNKRWKLYVPRDIREYLYKGVKNNDGI